MFRLLDQQPTIEIYPNIFHIPIDSYKISSWLYKNSHVYNETFCDIDFVGNKDKAKISYDKLNSFKSNFPEIELYTI